MQILLASFALMSLVFAGCNAKKVDDSTVNPAEETEKTEETTTVTDGTVQVEVAPTETTTTAQ